MKRLLLACAAVALVAPGATATSGSCLDLADPAGDRFVLGGQPTVVLDGTDLVNVRAEATTSAVTVVFSVADAPDPAPGVTYTYRFWFDDGTDFYMFNAETTGLGLRLPLGEEFELRHQTLVINPGGSTGTSSWEDLPATGSVDVAAKTVTVSAPASSFGSLTSGQQWTVDRATTETGVAGSKITDDDNVQSTDTLVVGAACS